MGRDALQGIESIEALINHTISELKTEISKTLPMETVKDLARQIASPMDGFTLDSRLFAIELETAERTEIRNGILRVLSSKKYMSKK